LFLNPRGLEGGNGKLEEEEEQGDTGETLNALKNKGNKTDNTRITLKPDKLRPREKKGSSKKKREERGVPGKLGPTTFSWN